MKVFAPISILLALATGGAAVAAVGVANGKSSTTKDPQISHTVTNYLQSTLVRALRGKNTVVDQTSSRQLSSVSAWSQIGIDFDGESAGNNLGDTIAVSADGHIVAIGSDSAGSNAGLVQVYNYNQDINRYFKRGLAITGDFAGDRFGSALSLSASGNVLAVGAPYNDDGGADSGHVQVFEYDGNNYVERGSTIVGDATGDWFGNSVDLSSNGNVLAVGAPRHAGNGNSWKSGQVKVYEFTGGTYIQRGSAIVGDNRDDNFGSSLALASEGNVLAVGARFHYGHAPSTGQVKIFEFTNGEYTQRGSDIVGNAAGDQLGNAVALSELGDVLAVGASYSDDSGAESGQVQVFQYDGSDYVKRGSTLVGDAAGDWFGYAVDLSSNGGVLAIGSPNGASSGQVKIFEYNGNDYIQQGDAIIGEATIDRHGQSLALASEGDIVAVGAPLNDGNGERSGSARVYIAPANYCGCSECTQEVMDTDAVADYGTWTCKERIDWQVSQGNDEKTACTMISNEFPSTCGPMCHPTECASAKINNVCSCPECTQSVLNSDANGYTCGDRINWVVTAMGYSELDACELVANEYPSICGKCHGQHCGAFCGTPSCTDDVLSSDAGGATCGARINWVAENVAGYSETDACELVANEYPSICGGCHP